VAIKMPPSVNVTGNAKKGILSYTRKISNQLFSFKKNGEVQQFLLNLAIFVSDEPYFI